MADISGAGQALRTRDDATTLEETTLDLRVASILIILVAGLLGALSPLHVKAWRDPHNLLQRLTRSFSAGAILALAIIHVMPDAYEALSKSMQEERGQLMGGSTVLLGIFAMVVIESMANQMLCPSSQSPVHVHGCNQYHASRAPTSSKTELADVLGGDGEDTAQPLLAADMLSDALAHAGVHAGVHAGAHQEEEQKGGEVVRDGLQAVGGSGEMHGMEGAPVKVCSAGSHAVWDEAHKVGGAHPAGEWDATEGGREEGLDGVGSQGGCLSDHQQQQEHGIMQHAVGVESKPEPLAGVLLQQSCSKLLQGSHGSHSNNHGGNNHSNQCSFQHEHHSLSDRPHHHQGSACARQHPLHLQHLQDQLQQHGHEHHSAHKFLHLPHHQQTHIAIPAEEPQTTSGHQYHHDHHHDHHHGACSHHHGSGSHTHNDHRQSFQRKVMAYMLELGCVFHSLFIGLSLGVTVEGRPQVYALVIALAVHQLLEGLALGSVVAAANFGKYSGMSMAVMYSLTTPIGVALGIMASGYYETMSSSVGLTVQGLANAASAGMLLYIALVQLITEHNKYVALQYTANQRDAAREGPHSPPSSSTLPASPASFLSLHSSRHQRICFVPVTVLMSHASLVAGAALMWAMGFWS